jgi:hypothetical protein
MCADPQKPFKCIDNSCVAKPELCSRPQRINTDSDSTEIESSISIYDNIKLNFAYSRSGVVLGKLYIPANSFYINEGEKKQEDKNDQDKISKEVSKKYGKLYVKTVADSILRNVTYNSSHFFEFDLNSVLPESGGKLNFENSVVSPIFQISTSLNVKNETLKLSGYVDISNDYYIEAYRRVSKVKRLGKIDPKTISPDNTQKLEEYNAEDRSIYIDPSLNYTDYCFAQLVKYNSDETITSISYNSVFSDYYWRCLERKTSFDQTIFKLNSLGIFAVILNPERTASDDDISNKTNFLLKNLLIILIAVIILIVVCAVIFYVFSRILRYREKYLDHKIKIKNLEKQIEEIRLMGTDVPGQTLGDNLAGIVFTKNPIHKIVKIEKGSVAEIENQLEEVERKCKILNSNAQNMEEEINELDEYYKILKREVD